MNSENQPPSFDDLRTALNNSETSTRSASLKRVKIKTPNNLTKESPSTFNFSESYPFFQKYSGIFHKGKTYHVSRLSFWSSVFLIVMSICLVYFQVSSINTIVGLSNY